MFSKITSFVLTELIMLAMLIIFSKKILFPKSYDGP